jgi:hypothetical protein
MAHLAPEPEPTLAEDYQWGDDERYEVEPFTIRSKTTITIKQLCSLSVATRDLFVPLLVSPAQH